MKELNELVELANKALVAGQGTPEMVDFRVTANPDAILAIAEAFRKLEQRAEAAGAKVKELEQEQAEHDEQIAALQGKFDLALAGLRSKTERCGKAETELEALKKQHPIGRVDRGAATDSNEYPDAHVVCLHEHVGWEAFQDGTELFTRPAPATSLAELVPGAITYELAQTHCHRIDRPDITYGFHYGANWMRATILRNIEQHK